jgi:hypothetical protein
LLAELPGLQGFDKVFSAKEGFELTNEKEQLKGETLHKGNVKRRFIFLNLFPHFHPKHKLLLAQVHFLYVLHVSSAASPSGCME